ncbi:MAG: DNA replication/repair protein RecF [Stenotrophobium sp.]
MTHIALLQGENFRLFDHLELKPNPHFNLIFGENAAGKTSLLESIYCFGRAKSFRGSSPAELAGAKGRYWRVSGRAQQAGMPAAKTSVNWTPEGTDIRSAQGSEIKAAELIKSIPVQVIDPTMHRLLQDGPGYRRSFLDWGVFHVEHQFFPVWRRHQRALKQRNRALRQKAPNREVAAWDTELAECAESLKAFRKQHLASLAPLMTTYVAKWFTASDWSADLDAGWPEDVPYLQVLKTTLERDKRMGMTVDGAHRAELRLRLDQHMIKNRVSRGQQKLLISALILSQARLIHQQTQRAPVLLVDDFSAELATDYQKVLLDMLKEYPGQVFLTAFGMSEVFKDLQDIAMFHVEHGQVRQC